MYVKCNATTGAVPVRLDWAGYGVHGSCHETGERSECAQLYPPVSRTGEIPAQSRLNTEGKFGMVEE